MTKEMLIAKNIVERLHLAGKPALFAGGCVRDMLLGIEPNDIDIVTLATPDEVEVLFKRTVPVGKQFGVIVVLEGGFEFEVATARTDSRESDGRRPDSVSFSSMEADAQRRDLTINGMFLDPMTGEVHDFVGGKDDLAAKVIRFIGDPRERIEEDKLRMLRAVRFATRLGFDMDAFTKDIIRRHAHLITQVSKERIKAEVDKMLVCDSPSKAFDLMREVDLLGHILPDVAALWDCEQSPKWHSEGNTGIHSMMVLDATREKTSDLPTLWSALLHDVGKPATSKINESGNISCHGHDKLGAEMADVIMRDLKSSNDEREKVVSLVQDHMRIGEATEMKKSTLRRLVSSPHFDSLLVLLEADCLSSHPIDKSREDTKFEAVVFLKEFVSTFEEVKVLPPALISGRDLIEMGGKPGPKFREILDAISDMQLEGEIETVQEALEKARAML